MSEPETAGARASWGARARARLDDLASAATWRVVGAFAATLLSVVATSGGLFLYASEAQAALLGGACAALIAPTRRSSAIVAGVAVWLGMSAGPANLWAAAVPWYVPLGAAVIAGLMAAVIAWILKSTSRLVPRWSRRLTWAVIVLLIANVWVTTINLARSADVGYDGVSGRPVFQLLSETTATVKPADSVIDQYAFLQVVEALKRGEPFYRTWRDELGPKRVPHGSAGNSVVNYHLPAIFWFWTGLPGTSVSIVYAYLVLLSLAIAAVPFVTRGTVGMPLAIPGAAGVSSYLLVYGYSLMVLSAEAWAAALGVLALAAWARSSASCRWRTWTVLAVVLGVLAALVREPAILIPFAGLCSALFVRDRQRAFRASAWAAGLGAFAVAYAVHYVYAQPWLDGPGLGAMLRLTGPETIISALTFGTRTLGGSGVLPLLLACLGLAGIFQVKDRRTRVFVGAAVLSSMLAYLFVTNGARSMATGAVINYWGIVIVPMIYACMPALFSVLPAMSPTARPVPFEAPSEDPGNSGGPSA